MGLGHGVAVVVQQHHRIGEEQRPIEVCRLADHGQGVELATVDDLAGGVEVDVRQLGQGDQEGCGPARAQEAGQHLGRHLARGPEFFDIGQAFGVVGRQDTVVGGDAGATGGEGAFQQRRIEAGVLLEDLRAQAGLNYEIHIVQQVGRQAGALNRRLVQGRIDLGAFDRRF